MSRIHKAACRFCGQIITFEDDETMKYEEEIEEATRRCSCDTAKEYREKEEKKDKAINNIDILFGKNAKEEDKVNEIVVDLLKELTDQICERVIKKASIEIKSGKKAVISRTNKGEIKISREEKKKQEITE